MLVLYVVLIGIIIAAALGISERSWKDFFEGAAVLGLLGALLGFVLTLLGSGIATSEARSVPVVESGYTVYSLNEVFGDSYEDNEYILFKDNELVVYVKDAESDLIVEKELTSNVKICYSDTDAGAYLTETEYDYANSVIRHLFWDEFPVQSIIEIPSGSTIIPYGDMFIKEAK
jgi:hypothetical protein